MNTLDANENLEEFKTQINDAAEEYRKLSDQIVKSNQDAGKSIEALNASLDDLAAHLSDSNRQTRSMSDGDKYFKATREAVEGLNGALSAGSGIASLFGAKQEALAKVQEKLQNVMTIMEGTQQALSVLDKESYLNQTLLTKAKTLNATVTGVLSKGLLTMGVSANVANVAARGLMVTLTGGLIVGVWALISVFDKLKQKKEENRRKAEELAKAEQEFADEIGKGSSKSISDFEKLATAYAKVGNTADAKKKFLKDYREELDKTGLSIQNVNDLEKLFSKEGKTNYINSVIARAKADAFRALAQKDVEKLVSLQEKQTKLKNPIVGVQNGKPATDPETIDILNKMGLPNDGKEFIMKTAIQMVNDDIAAKNLQREIDILIGNIEARMRSAFNYDVHSGNLMDKTGLEKLNPSNDKDNKNQSDAQSKKEDAKKEYYQIEREAAENLSKAKRDAEIELTKGTREEIEKRYQLVIDDLAKQEQAYKEAKVRAGEAETVEDVKLPDVFQQRRGQAENDRNREYTLFDAEKAKKELGEYEKLASIYIEKTNELDTLRETRSDPKKLKESGFSMAEITALIDQKDAELQIMSQNLYAMLDTDNMELQAFVETIAGAGIQQAATVLQSLQAKLDELQGEAGYDENAKKQIPSLQAKIRLLEQQLAVAIKEASANGNEDSKNSPADKWKNLYSSLTKVDSGLGEIANQFKGVSDEADAAIDTAKTFVTSSMTMINGIAQIANGTIGATGAAATSAGAAIKGVETASVILTIISAALQITMAIINLVKKKKAAEAAKETERIQANIDNLKKSYEELEKAVDKAYSSDARELLAQGNELIEQQKQQLQLLIAQEEAKAKNSNKKKEREEAEKNAQQYREQLASLDEQMEDNKTKMVDVMFGEDVKAAIDRFADYYVESFGKSNEEVKKNQKQFVKDMVKNMIMQMIKGSVSDQMEKLREKMIAYLSDGVLSSTEEAILDNMVAEMNSAADEKLKNLGKYLESDDTGSGREAEAAKGIAKASQESVDENNALLTTMVGHTRELVDLKKQMLPKVDNIGADLAQTLGVIRGIKEDTGAIRNDVSETKNDTKTIKSVMENIRDHGVAIKK